MRPFLDLLLLLFLLGSAGNGYLGSLVDSSYEGSWSTMHQEWRRMEASFNESYPTASTFRGFVLNVVENLRRNAISQGTSTDRSEDRQQEERPPAPGTPLDAASVVGGVLAALSKKKKKSDDKEKTKKNKK